MLSVDDYRVPDHAPELRVEDEPYPPINIDAERTILGAVLLDNAALTEAEAKLLGDDFALDSHRRIFLRMTDLAKYRRPIDIVTLAEELARNKEVEAIGGVAYLASLTEGLPRRPVIDEYIRIVKDKSIARRMMTLGTLMTAQAAAGDAGAAQLLDIVQAHLAVFAEEIAVNDPEGVLVKAIDFALERPATVEWLVEGVIQRHANGIFAGDGKTGKSLLAIHLLLHLASGTDWMGLKVPRRVPVALISREDDPGETARRIASFVAGCSGALATYDIEDYFWLNTRAQTPTFTLENKRELQEVIAALKRRQVEFAVFDVFRSIWTGDENDNREVSVVLEALRRVQREVGCAVGLIHHLNKTDGVNIFSKLRGASAIRGWQEWGFAVAIANPEEDEDKHVRVIRFETKAARPHRRMYYTIAGAEESMYLEPCGEPVIKAAKKAPLRDMGTVITMTSGERGCKLDD